MIELRRLVLNLVEGSPIRWLLFNRRRWLAWAVATVLLVLGGSVGGWLIAETSPLVVAVLGAGIVYAVWVLSDLEMAYVGVIGIVSLLPFASLPFSVGFTPTFLDLVLLALFGAWGLQFLMGEEQRIVTTAVGGPVLAFTLLAVVAFVAGLANGAFTSFLVRHFAEILLSIAIFYVVVNSVRDTARLGRLVRWVILGAAAAAAVGIVLYLVPETLAIRALSALGRFGYPTGQGVIWHIRDDPELMKRATATSVHPNVLGSLLSFGLAMLVPQLLSKRTVLPKAVAWGSAVVLGIGLVMTVSRSAMLGVGAATVVISAMRYRRLLLVIPIVLVLVLVSPWSTGLINHFLEGFQLEDLSTQMRMGEYKDALTLIQRYPFLGVGFAGAPDIDIYVAVASLYFTVAAQMGLLGLLSFVVVLGAVLWRFWRRRALTQAAPALEPLWYGLHAAIIAGVVSGFFDRFFFSLDFHNSVTLFWLVVGLATAATELLDAASHKGAFSASAG
ncbi:MAG: O-antigen ligase family protein [Anaerolineae bacterium]|nr:O-antigen ligase family protein [Anaerolineae bacterium]